MAGRLTARKVETAKAGKHSDGGNLYLIVSPKGARKWVLRFTWRGKAREMGLGSATTVSLADAREKAASARRQRAAGVDPLATKRAQRAAARPAMTFSDCAGRYIAAHEASWENAEHRRQWRSTIAQYVEPIIGALPVVAVRLWPVLDKAAISVAEPLAATEP